MNDRAPTTDEQVHELTEWHNHRSTLNAAARRAFGKPAHIIRVPPLLDQLATGHRMRPDGGRQATGYVSRPTANLDTLGLLQDIEHEAREWLTRYGLKTTGGLSRMVLRLNGHRPTLDDTTRRDLEHTLGHWHRAARIMTGWDSPPWRPNVVCPMCQHRGSLVINLAVEGAHCTACRATWDSLTIGLLGAAVQQLETEAATRREQEDDTA